MVEISGEKKTEIWASRLSVLLVIFFMVAELRPYMAGRPLRYDEWALLTNLKARNFHQLLQPLAFEQAAPVGFLWVSKIIGRWFAYAPRALRIVPLLAGLLSVILMFVNSRAIVGAWWALVALPVYGMAPLVLYFASDFKQYSTDTMVSSVLIYLTVRWLADTDNTLWPLLLTLVAPLAIGVSYPAIFVFVGVILARLIPGLPARRKNAWFWLIVVALASVGSWLLLLLATVLPASRNQYLLHFWRDAFWPLWPVRIRTFTFPLYNAVEIFRRPVGLESGGLGLVLAAVGAAWLWRKEQALFALLVMPLLAAMVASGLHMYPFAERLLLFTVPSMVLLVVLGLRALWRQDAWSRVAAVVSLVVILGLESIRMAKMLPLNDIAGFLR